MARGRQTTRFLVPDELVDILKKENDRSSLHCIVGLPRTTDNVQVSMAHLFEYLPTLESLALVLIRSQELEPLKAPQYYNDNLIAEGLIQIEPPFILPGNRLMISTMLVGTDPPHPGIESPLPLFNRLSRAIKAIACEPVFNPRTRVTERASKAALAFEAEGGTLSYSARADVPRDR